MAIMDGNNHLQPDYNAPRNVPQGPSEEELRRWHQEYLANKHAVLERQRQEDAMIGQTFPDMGGSGAGGSFDGPYLMGDMVVYPDDMYRGLSPEEARQERLYRQYMATQAGYNY